GLDHGIGLPTPCAPCITVCRRIKHAQQVSISSALLTRSHVGGTELWSTGGLCSYAACTHMQSASSHEVENHTCARRIARHMYHPLANQHPGRMCATTRCFWLRWAQDWCETALSPR